MTEIEKKNDECLFVVVDDEECDKVQVWTLGKEGVIDEGGEHLDGWSVRRNSDGEINEVRIFQGDHWERGDREESYGLDVMNSEGEFFTLSLDAAEAHLQKLRATRAREKMERELFKQAGLDDESIKNAREETLRALGLDDESVQNRRQLLLCLHVK